jgi:hypothetical protein
MSLSQSAVTATNIQSEGLRRLLFQENAQCLLLVTLVLGRSGRLPGRLKRVGFPFGCFVRFLVAASNCVLSVTEGTCFLISTKICSVSLISSPTRLGMSSLSRLTGREKVCEPDADGTKVNRSLLSSDSTSVSSGDKNAETAWLCFFRSSESGGSSKSKRPVFKRISV